MSEDRYTNSHLGTSNESKGLEYGVLVALLLAGAFALSPNMADPDLWGHVQYGRDAIGDGLARTTTYSYTADGYRWINHENLAELLLAWGADTIGPKGLVAAKIFLGVWLLGLIMRHARTHHVSLMTLCLVTLLVSVNLTYHWALRPQLLTYTYYTLMLLLLTWCFEGWAGRWRLSLIDRRADIEEFNQLTYSPARMKALWLAPPLFCIWANSHGGFVAGFCLFALYLMLRSLEAVACRGRRAKGLLLQFGTITLATGLATFLNPYGPGLHQWLLRALQAPRPEITEWHPPNLFGPEALPLWLIMVVWAFAMLFSRRSRDFTHMVMMAVALWQTLEHQRHGPFFVIAFGLWMPVHMESVLRQLHMARDSTAFGGGVPRPMRWVLTVCLLLVLVLLVGRLSRRLGDMPVARDTYPVSAFEYMAERDLHGKLVVTYNWAQYAIAAFGTDDPDEKGMQVAFDGRFRTCYPQEVVDMHFDLIAGDTGPGRRYRSPNSPPIDGGRVLEYRRPDLVLINRFQPHSEEVMYRHSDQWVLLYQDKLAQLWGRATRYNDPASPDFIGPEDRNITNAPQFGSLTWPGLPRRPSSTKLAVNNGN